jgi:hypothetical protein
MSGDIDQQPLFGCAYCATEVSLPASELYVFEGSVWCSECLLNQKGEDSLEQIQPYTPTIFAKVVELQAQVERLQLEQETNSLRLRWLNFHAKQLDDGLLSITEFVNTLNKPLPDKEPPTTSRHRAGE